MKKYRNICAEALKVNPHYLHDAADITDEGHLESLFKETRFDVIVHTAAQPSHDLAATIPLVDFDVNAKATLNLLNFTHKYCPEAVFVFTSTNKVYGDNPNRLPLVDIGSRLDLPEWHQYHQGVNETMSIDGCVHSLFGVSKTAADLYVQEYINMGLKAAVFRGGCLTGSEHQGAQLHGFLSYIVKCAVQEKPYTIFGYGGKQVRDNIHASDLADAFWEFISNPYPDVYNIGGGRGSDVSVLEVATMLKNKGFPLNYTISPEARRGDHRWWVTDCSKFERNYPNWKRNYYLHDILDEMIKREVRCLTN
jgi:CDP-paratose 2-epimerase